MIEAFAAQIALALERVHYVEIARDALVNMESERLRNSLLSAISHDLRTPLTTIVGFSSMLAQARAAQNAAEGAAAHAFSEDALQEAQHTQSQAIDDLVEAIHEESMRMAGIVTNLLDMARLQAGGLQLNRQWSLLEETVGAALRACRRVLAGHPVQVQLPADLPLLQLDAVLMERLFSNLFENAAKYTPADTPLTIGAQRIDEDGKPYVRVSVDDCGPGLPVGMESRIFEKFTRGEKESAKPGIGLGLAICRAIVDAHGGTIGAANRLSADGRIEGARFWFTLPAETPPPVPEVLDEALEELDDEAQDLLPAVTSGLTSAATFAALPASGATSSYARGATSMAASGDAADDATSDASGDATNDATRDATRDAADGASANALHAASTGAPAQDAAAPSATPPVAVLGRASAPADAPPAPPTTTRPAHE
jgi:two-component system sensor histidine kinase KdpD